MNALYSQIVGKGKPLVILHGFLGMGDNWKTLANQFAEAGYEVHLVDQRNHGRSFHSDAFDYGVMADDLKNYCMANDLEPIVLLGHSMGVKLLWNLPHAILAWWQSLSLRILPQKHIPSITKIS